jgi:hypothetical protein
MLHNRGALRSRSGATYICRTMRNDSSINLRLPSDLRDALDVRAAEWSENYGVDLSTADLLRIGAKQLLEQRQLVLKPPAVEGRP